MNAIGRGELPEGQSDALEQAFATLARLAEVGGLLDGDVQRTGGAPPGQTAETTTTAPLIELKEEQLRLAEARYRVLIEQIPAVTFIASLVGETNEIYVSPQIEALLGFTQEEWVSDPILWYRQVHIEDREWLSRGFANAIVTGQPVRGLVRVFTRDGVMRWVQLEARFVRNDHGLPLFLQGAGFDVTEQVHAQEAREQLLREQAARADAERQRQRLQEVFTTLPAAIAVLRGPDYAVEFLNPVASELAGGGADVIGKPWTEAFPEFGEETVRALDAVCMAGGLHFLREYPVSAARWGGDRYFNFVVQPLPDIEDRETRILAHAVDVTGQVLARRGVEQALQLRSEALAQARETLKMREDFLSSAAHDLKTPVAAIKGRAQLLNRQIARMDLPNSERLLESVTAIESSATRMTAMIEELLDLARMQAGQPLSLDRRPTDLVRLVRQAVADLKQQTRRHRIRIEASDPELVGTWDPVRLTRVLNNLLDNATKYSPEGGDILVTVGRDPQAPDYAMFQVQDFGVGIGKADLPHVFERFHRGSNVVGRIAGTGIGLTGSYHIVQEHGGTMNVASQEGAGSTFTVRLPLQEK